VCVVCVCVVCVVCVCVCGVCVCVVCVCMPGVLRRRSAAARLLRLGGSKPTGGMDVSLL